MKQSLSMTAYLALARREPIGTQDLSPTRPEGALVWLHCSEPAHARVLGKLGMRLASQRNLSLLLTVPPNAPIPDNIPDSIILSHAPGENPFEIARFLDHWAPNLLLWKGPGLRPSVLHGARQRAIPLFLLDADDCHIENRRARLLPDPLGGTLNLFDLIFARGTRATQRLRRLVGPGRKVQQSGALLEDSTVLSCNETDLEELGEALKARPLWLAARLQSNELDIVFDAHRMISRVSPRMLLILVPEVVSDASIFRQRCLDAGLSVSLWDEGEMPSEKTDVLLAEDRRELGLFYRIAPITLLGSSLHPGRGGRNPLEPAALGSAVLYGPSVKRYLDTYSRLAKSGGARIVKDKDSLFAALETLMAPDRVAAMVHAGWETVSEGAEVIDQVVDHVIDALEQKGAL